VFGPGWLIAGDGVVSKDRTQRAGLPTQVDVEPLVERAAEVHEDDRARFLNKINRLDG